MRSSTLLLTSYALLSVALFYRLGTYSAACFALVALAFAACIAAAATQKKHSDGGTVPARMAAVIVILFAGLGMLVIPNVYAPAIYITSARYLHFVQWSHAAVMGLVVVGYLRDNRRRGEDLRKIAFLLAVALGVAAHAWLPSASPQPKIDVFAMEQGASQLLLHGQNPYVETIENPYTDPSFGYALTHYTYLPLNLLVELPAYALTHDVRYAHLLAMLCTAFLLWKLCKDEDPVMAELLALLFLYNPLSLFVLEQSWTEPIILLGFALYALAYAEKKTTLAAVMAGLTLSLKQYLFILPLPLFRLFRSWKNIAILCGVTMATMALFALWSWNGFLQNGVLFQLTVPLRTDTLSVPSFFFHGFTMAPSPVWDAIVAVLSLTVPFLLWRTKTLTAHLLGITLSAFTLFFLGSRGITNYYWLTGGLMLLSLAVMTKKENAVS